MRASGRLSGLPLGMLVSEIPEGASGDPEVLRNARWLADQYALIQTPNLQSIRFLREIRQDRQADSDTDTWAHPNAWAPFVLVGDR